jgi:hypothetical protein
MTPSRAPRAKGGSLRKALGGTLDGSNDKLSRHITGLVNPVHILKLTENASAGQVWPV